MVPDRNPGFVPVQLTPIPAGEHAVAAKSQIAGQACAHISQLYDIERQVKT